MHRSHTNLVTPHRTSVQVTSTTATQKPHQPGSTSTPSKNETTSDKQKVPIIVSTPDAPFTQRQVVYQLIEAKVALHKRQEVYLFGEVKATQVSYQNLLCTTSVTYWREAQRQRNLRITEVPSLNGRHPTTGKRMPLPSMNMLRQHLNVLRHYRAYDVRSLQEAVTVCRQCLKSWFEENENHGLSYTFDATFN
jgi:hypothetical protein